VSVSSSLISHYQFTCRSIYIDPNPTIFDWKCVVVTQRNMISVCIVHLNIHLYFVIMVGLPWPNYHQSSYVAYAGKPIHDRSQTESIKNTCPATFAWPNWFAHLWQFHKAPCDLLPRSISKPIRAELVFDQSKCKTFHTVYQSNAVYESVTMPRKRFRHRPRFHFAA
jgi:hypothetical protein